jgi:mRNA interferase RelE/StbE
MYSVKTTAKFDKQIRKLDKSTALRITNWLRRNIDSTRRPRLRGKALKGSLKDLWCYRIGTYRVLAQIHDNELVILCVTVEHRRSVYD